MNNNTINDDQPVLNSYYYQIRSEDGRNYAKGPDFEIFTQFTIDLFEPLVCFDNQSFVVSLASMEFPYSFYTTNSTNNRIPCYTEVISTGLTSAVANLTIPPGNYDANSFATALTTAFDNQFSADPTAPCTITITYSKTTGKYNMLLNQADRRAYLTFNSAPVANMANKQVGVFDLDVVFTQASMLAPGTDSIANLQPLYQNIYVRTDLATQVSANTAVENIDNILQKVPAWGCPFSWIYFTYNQMAKPTWVKKKNIQSITLRITDINDNLIDTNLVHFTLTLKFDVVRRPSFLMPDNERRIDSLKDIKGAGYNPGTGGIGGMLGPLWETYYNPDVYQELRKDKGVREGFHNWMMRKEQLSQQESQEFTKRNKEQEKGQQPGKLKSEEKTKS